MKLSTLCLLALFVAPVAPEAKGAVGACAYGVSANHGEFELSATPPDHDSIPLLYADEEEGEDDDFLISQIVFFNANSLASAAVALSTPLPSPCPVLSSGAARSPPSD